MAAHWMFPEESDLQASCLNLKGGSSNITETHTKSGSVNCGWGMGGDCFPPHCPSFSSEISHCESTVVRMNEMLHAKHLAGGLTHTFNRGSNYCYCFTIINKDNSCKKSKHIQLKQGRGFLWQPLHCKGDICKSESLS